MIGIDQYAENIKRKIDATDDVPITEDQYENLIILIVNLKIIQFTLKLMKKLFRRINNYE